MTEQTQPTEAEIDTLILEHGVLDRAWPTQRQLHAFARAVLAKWGTPAPVGVEPIGHLYSSGAGEVVYQASYQDGFWQDCSRERYEYLKAPKISSSVDWTSRILYTAPQPSQAVSPAGREPLPFSPRQRERLFNNRPANVGKGLALADWHRVVEFIEAAHGIKAKEAGDAE